MTTYKKAADQLTEAIKYPKDKDKLAEAKKNPKLKDLLRGVSRDDMVKLNKIAKGGGIIKCTED